MDQDNYLFIYRIVSIVYSIYFLFDLIKNSTLLKNLFCNKNSIEEELKSKPKSESTIIRELIDELDKTNKLICDDMDIIIKNMDKKDYRCVGNYPRWIDLDKIVLMIVKLKTKYTFWKLLHIELVKLDKYSSIPKNDYIYYFSDGENMIHVEQFEFKSDI